MCLEDSGRLFAAFRTFSCTRIFKQTPRVIFPCKPYSVDKSSLCWAVERQTMSFWAHGTLGKVRLAKQFADVWSLSGTKPAYRSPAPNFKTEPQTRCPPATRRSQGLGALPFQEQALRSDRLRLRKCGTRCNEQTNQLARKGHAVN